MSDYFKRNVSEINYYSSDNWIVLHPIELSIKKKIEENGIKLSDWDLSINRGILTGYNDAFIIDETTKNMLIDSDPKSVELIRPFDLNNSSTTFREIYEQWSKEKFENASKSTINGYRASYNTCIILFERTFRELKTSDLQKVIDTCGKNYPTLKNIKILFNQLYKYVMKNDICNKDYSKYVDIAKYSDKNPNSVERKPFTKEQIDIFWDLSDDIYYQIILMLIYTGVRISEMLDLKKENVYLDEQYFEIIDSKTENGIRKVPISDYILPFFKNWYESSKIEYLLHTPEQQHFKYRNYYDSYFRPLLDRFHLDHTPHCCRHTLVSLMAEAKVSSTFNKMIIGHAGAMSLNEKVYTHIDMKELIKTVNSVYYPSFIKKDDV